MAMRENAIIIAITNASRFRDFFILTTSRKMYLFNG